MDRALADESLTTEERANLELVLKFRGLPFSERSKYTVDGFRPRRIGMANLGELKAPESVAYDGESIPDREDQMLDIIAREDRVWALWLIRGTQRGELYGIPPTGRRVEVLELGQWTLRDGLITDAFFMADELALVRQLGRWPEAEDGSQLRPDQTSGEVRH